MKLGYTRRRVRVQQAIQKALEDSRREPRELVTADEPIADYAGFPLLAELLREVEDICDPDTGESALDGFLVEKRSVQVRKRSIENPVVHLLFGGKPDHFPRFKEVARGMARARQIGTLTYRTEDFLATNRKSLNAYLPIYLRVDVAELCPAVIKPGMLRRVLARFRHPIRGYGKYPRWA